jgi:transcriptional regulator with XRE-family HTH domain
MSSICDLNHGCPRFALLKPRAAHHARRDRPLRSNAATRFDQIDRFDSRATARLLQQGARASDGGRVWARCSHRTLTAELLGMATRSYNRWERGGHLPSLEMLVKAADILAVSLDELVGRQAKISEPTIRNAELHQLVQEVDQLPDREQQAVIVMLDGLLRSAQVTRAVNRRGGARRAASR